MKKIHCRTAAHEYDILIGPESWKQTTGFPGRKLLVRDGNVTDPGIPADGTAVLTPGEQHKTFGTVESICRAAARLRLNRKDRFIALGGGVTGDLTGFAAAIYMRGVPFIQIPTTLLAMVDASVGGKTAADLPEGKNLIGAFHQPDAVFIDPGFLRTLPRKELICGMAEVVKTAVILDGAFFDRLEALGSAPVAAPDYDCVFPELIGRCCELKASVVEADEKEQGLRAILNYGHTYGHAVEQLSSFTIPHGEGVAMGMTAAGMTALLLGMWTKEEFARQQRLLAALELPTALPRSFAPEKIIEIMGADKKNDHSGIRLVLPERLGAARTVSGVPLSLMRQALEACHD